MTTGQDQPIAGAARRSWAALALLALLGVVVVFVFFVADSPWVVLGAAVALFVAVLSGWEAVTRRGGLRLLGAVVLVVAVIALVALLVVSRSVAQLLVAAVFVAISIVAAQQALGDIPEGAATDAPAGEPLSARPKHPVLIMNPKSGGGKAEKFELERRCRERGIEPIVLRLGVDDLLQVAEDAVARGADVLGMAGGDGSQALVASVASKHDLPHVVIPAGTRNHFALDLGLDRDDVVGALDAYERGVERRIDLAEVNGRTFVNNASMGVYAKVVQSPEYRDAKLRTAAAQLPDVIGANAEPLDLRFTPPGEEEQPTASLILVSNNAYDLEHLRGGGTRPRIDAGTLGVVTLHVTNALDAEKLAALEVAGQVSRFPGWRSWEPAQFEVRSDDPVEIGVDGEALRLEAPLRFTVRPGALRVLLPPQAGSSPAATIVRPTSHATVLRLVDVVRGRLPVG